MIRVLFDHQIFSLQSFGGISRSFAECLDSAEACQGDFEFRCGALISANHHLHNTRSWSGRRLNTQSMIGKGLAFGVNRLAQRRMSRQCDVVHTTYYVPSELPREPFVVTVHDMIPELYPALDSGALPKAWKEYFCRRASRIVCVSESTKRDVIDIYGIPQDRLEVVHHGIAVAQATRLGHQPTAWVPHRYILYVGKREAYKNFTAVLSSLCLLHREDATIELVCAGEKFSREEQSLLHKLGLNKRVHQVKPTDAELRWLYGRALAFVFPSLYEGFGLPILEAFAQRCPVVLARASCFPEVAGEFAWYFDPEDPSDLARAIIDVISDGKSVQALTARARSSLEGREWHTAVKRLEGIYASIVQ